MHSAQRQFVMPIHNLGARGGERILSDEVMEHMPEHIDGNVLHTRTPRHHTEIGRLGNQGGHERFIEMWRPGLVPLHRREVTAKTGELVNLHQELFDPDRGQARIDHLL